MAPISAPILVPMLVDAYINYPPPFQYEGDYGNMPPAPNKAYLGPIPQPKYASPKDDNAWIQHDMFDHMPQPPLFRGRADPARLSYERAGIYVSWRLPAHYRTGMTASSDDADFKTKLAEGGYANVDAPGTGTSGTRFRQVPNRWIICRTVTPMGGNANYISIENPNSQSKAYNPPSSVPSLTRPYQESFYYGTREMNGQPVGYSKDMIRSYFVVEGDTVREIESLSEVEDIDVTAAPFIDEKFPISQQSQSFLGRSMPLEVWDSDHGPSKRSTTLTVARSTNPYFADFQPQNSSVFSFFDDLKTTVADPAPTGDGQFWPPKSIDFWISNGAITYSIVGYHRTSDFDPLAMPLMPNQSANDRLSVCRLSLKSTTGLSPNLVKALDTKLAPGGPAVQMRTLCSGTLANIKYSNSSNGAFRAYPAMVTPGDDIQDAFIRSHPLSLGTNPIDALFGWLRSQPPSSGKDPQAALMRLQSYILDNNDDLDSQLQAEDLLSTNNFIRDKGGLTWHIDPLPGSGGQAPIQLPDATLDIVRTLNAAQRHSDALQRERQALQSQLFMCWWKYAADVGKSTRATLEVSQKEVVNIRTALSTNKSLMSKFATIIKQSKTNLSQFDLTELVEPVFAMQNDPTLLIAGAKNAFQPNPDKLNVRIAGQEKPLYNYGQMQVNNGDRRVIDLLNSKLEATLSPTVWSLTQEAQFSHGQQPLPFLVSPEYLNAGDTYKDQQGWFPLFIEWQIEYYHIPFEWWEFAPCGPESRWGYRIKSKKLADLKLTDDYRVVKGRSPILPQTSSTLNATLKQVYGKMNPDQLKAALGQTDANDLLQATLGMDYLSTAMSGLTDSLTTLVSEAHFVPVSFPGGQMRVADEAMASGKQLGLGPQDWTELSQGMSRTPFATLMDLPADIDKYSPFKPVTHGQFRFTKFNILDKFGQVVVGIDRVLSDQGTMTHNPLFPCLGETYSLETFDSKANAVMQRSDNWCSFVQIPPCINQPARVNASFVTRYNNTNGYSHAWRRIEEWENPVEGWIVVNSANVSLQLFTADGRFVREYSVLNGQVTTHPFAADTTAAADVDPLMAQLMQRFDQSPKSLTSMFQSINTTVQAVQANPSHYAESMLSILGRPLALTTFGFNIELESPPLTDQSTFKTSRTATPSVTDYNFSIKIGDGDNVFDGLYGLFKEYTKPPKSNTYFMLDQFYSYHSSDSGLQPPIVTTKPIWPTPSSIPNYTEFVDMNTTIFAALVDPFTPVHIYSALLPIKQLQLPSWTVDRAMARLASFFRKGPTLIASDVPTFHPNTSTQTFVVDRDIPLDDPKQPVQTGEIAVPAVSVGDWNWLQPYATSSSNSGLKYNELAVKNPDTAPRWERAPYVVTEGYLQMKKPFTAPDPVKAPELVFGPGPRVPS